jgi:hypothetical protein
MMSLENTGVRHMSSLSRNVINYLLPDGSAWEPASESDYDLLLDGIGDNSDAVKSDLDDLAHIRNPLTTTILSDLEKDFGVVPIDGATEAERRAILNVFKYRKTNSGAYDTLQTRLRNAGFFVYVYPNDPAVDPALFVDFVNNIRGELIINDPNLKEEYSIPTNSGYWSLFFFIGGPAVIDPEYGIISIQSAGIPDEQRKTFKNLVLQYKPMHSWCAYIDDYTAYLDGIRYLDGTWYLNGHAREVL